MLPTGGAKMTSTATGASLQVMRAFFLRLLMDGEIARLPELYAEFKDTVTTDLTLVDLLADIPLAIQLADPQRMAYHQISWDEVTQWLMPGRAKSIVLLPNRDAVTALIQEAVTFIMTPAAYSDLAATLQVQLTRACCHRLLRHSPNRRIHKRPRPKQPFHHQPGRSPREAQHSLPRLHPLPPRPFILIRR